jgi:DNA-binding CsgD family transcriptional regulator
MTKKLLAPLFSRRQYQVGMLLSIGKSVKEIYAETGMSRSTLQFHMANLRRKFGCSSNFQLGYELRPVLDDLTEALATARLSINSNFHWSHSPKDKVENDPFEETVRSELLDNSFSNSLEAHSIEATS